MSIKAYRFELTGQSPLLMHWDNILWGDQMKEWEKANKQKGAAGDDRWPAWRWHGYVYHDDKIIVVPGDNLRTCLMKAGAQVGTGKRGGTLKRRIPAAVLVDELFLPLFVNGKTIPIGHVHEERSDRFVDQVALAQSLGFDLLIKRASVGSSKHVRVRPVFRNWSIVGTLTVTDDQITEDVLEQVFGHAGREGLCDWRPGSPRAPGPYGRFTSALAAVK